MSEDVSRRVASDELPWTLKYEHEHGVDETDYATEELAVKGACHIIVSWWRDIDSKSWRAKIAEKIKQRDWDGAMGLWNNYQSEQTGEREYLSIAQRAEPVLDVPDPQAPNEDEGDDE